MKERYTKTRKMFDTNNFQLGLAYYIHNIDNHAYVNKTYCGILVHCDPTEIIFHAVEMNSNRSEHAQTVEVESLSISYLAMDDWDIERLYPPDRSE